MTAPPVSAPTTSVGDRIDGVQLALRIGVVVAGLAAVASIRLAATEPQPVLDLAILVLLGFCVLLPDWPAGLLVVMFVGVDWALAVDDPTTPWAMAAGAAVAMFHSTLALVTVAPIGARLEHPTRRRWARRTSLVVALVVPTWLAVVVAERLELGASQLLVGLALLVVAVGAMWLRRGDLGRG